MSLPVSIHTHLNAPKLRIDTWNILDVLAKDLSYSTNPENEQNLQEGIKHCFDILKPIEAYHAFPSLHLCNKLEVLFYKKEYEKFCELTSLIVQALRSSRCNYKKLLKILQAEEINREAFVMNSQNSDLRYFEVLLVEDLQTTEEEIFRKEMESYLTSEERFVYEFIIVKSFEDAIIATMFNFNIKCCLITDFFEFKSKTDMPAFKKILEQAHIMNNSKNNNGQEKHALVLGNAIKNLRPELDLYYLSSFEPEKSSATSINSFKKIFYSFESHAELHLSILQGIREHFETPFFDSLKKYTFEPKSAFHALPVARGKSVFNSKWINDMQEFYGKNIFLAESSSTAGGLDSLMNPVGSIKQAMKKAETCFGSKRTFFVTNGTSAANKIVSQAILQPNDIVLIEHTCHKSHHYGIIMTGAYPLYLNGYAVDKCDILGPVSLRTIKKQLLALKKAKLLHKVKMVVLTNCTFDGLVYNVQKYMEEILAIKPDMIFLWDEAWFAFARCIPHYRMRTAMESAAVLEAKYKTATYRDDYAQFKKQLNAHKEDANFWLNTHLLPDPDQVQIRVFATQSTHKTLSCLRQGSMIHVYDQYFETIQESFTNAFMANSTTSPNYQIIATMDLARRQLEMEGFELAQNAIELAMIFRQQVNQNLELNSFFKALGPSELIPTMFRQSHVHSGYDQATGWSTVEKAWILDDFVIDPTRVTLLITAESFDGYKMRQVLMEKFGIQVNKISIHSILFQFNIGTPRSAVSYLLEALHAIAKDLQKHQFKKFTPYALEFTEFHPEFLPHSPLAAGDLRKAYYLGNNASYYQHATLAEVAKQVHAKKQVISASIIIPEPPGYPLLLPGQVITPAIIDYLLTINPGLVLGYAENNRIKIFTDKAFKKKTR